MNVSVYNLKKDKSFNFKFILTVPIIQTTNNNFYLSFIFETFNPCIVQGKFAIKELGRFTSALHITQMINHEINY